jgi:exodeoxyribonuclease VII small subunit
MQACRAAKPPLSAFVSHSPNVSSKPPKADQNAGSDTSDKGLAQDFERSLAELEAIIDKLEQGELSLDESLRHFERGVQLTRVCQNALKQAEQKVEILLRKSGEDFAPVPFDTDDGDER